MKQRTFLRVFFALVFTFINSFSHADNNPPAYVSLALGHAGILDSDMKESTVAKIEYRSVKRLKWDLIPVVGAAHAKNDASFVFATVEKEYPINDHWIVSPSFGLGIFNDGRNLSLGNDLQFRSGVKLFYQFKNQSRVGLELYHLSNGGLSDHNPGTEPVFVSYSIPLK